MAWSVLKVPEFMGLRVAEIVGSVLLAIGFAVAARAEPAAATGRCAAAGR
jgi:hypothetical protein